MGIEVRSNGPTRRGTRSPVARRSAGAATTAMLNDLLNGSEVLWGILSKRGFNLTLRPERLDQPRRWRQPRMIFVNSMSDLFHKGIPLPFVDQVFETMEQANWHAFQVLTKRSSRMRSYVNRRYAGGTAPSHIWLGVSAEDGACLSRIAHLQQTAASVRFLSLEPLIGPVGHLSLSAIHWVIVGGESGPRARPMNIEWVRAVRDQCRSERVPFFFKQWGGFSPKSGGRLLEGKEWNQFPIALRTRTGSCESWSAA
jgi:protein gp37